MKRTALLLGVAFTAICMCAPFLWRVSSSAVAFSPEKVLANSVEQCEKSSYAMLTEDTVALTFGTQIEAAYQSVPCCRMYMHKATR